MFLSHSTLRRGVQELADLRVQVDHQELVEVQVLREHQVQVVHQELVELQVLVVHQVLVEVQVHLEPHLHGKVNGRRVPRIKLMMLLNTKVVHILH
jgi:hypothetical protein